MLTSIQRAVATENAVAASNHWPLLDFMRAAAALLVLFAHSRVFYILEIDQADQQSVFLKLFYFITALGDEAVVIFFVLSGFLIGGSLANSMRRGGFDLPRYLIARFSRIYAVYLPALIITQGIFLFGALALNDPEDGALSGHQELDFGGAAQAICYLSGLQGFSCRAWEQNPALWSLGFEWALYLFAPAIIQLIVWKAPRGLRLTALALVCAIAATICQYPSRAAFYFGVWHLGVASRRMFHAQLVPLPAGLLGAGLMIVGMALRHINATSQFEAGAIVALGAAGAIACRPLATYPFGARFFGWAAGFSYTLYAIHLPLVFFIVALFQASGFPRKAVAPSPAPFMEFGVTIAICLLAAYLVSLVTERKTGQIRAAMMRMRPPRKDPKAADRS